LKLLEKTKDAQTSSLSELQTELKSLKALLTAKASDPPRFGGSPFTPGGIKTNGGLPAWQLAGHNALKQSASSPTLADEAKDSPSKEAT
jgi:peroxin-14